MSKPTKLRAASAGKPVSEVTRFKELWRTQWTDEQKAEFIGWFSDSSVSHAEIRRRLEARHGLVLKFDSQLSGERSLRDWCWQEQANAAEAEWTHQEELELQRLGLKGEALRAALLDKIKARAYVRGDHKLGLKAIAADQKEKVISLDTEKFKEGLRTKLESGLAQLAEHIKGNAKAQAAYEAFRATIAETTK